MRKGPKVVTARFEPNIGGPIIVQRQGIDQPELVACENDDCICEYDPETYDQCPLCNHVREKK